MVKPKVGVALAASLVAGLLSVRHARTAPVSTWSMDPSEQAALAGLESGYRGLADALAPVVTDARTRFDVVKFVAHGVRELDAQEKDLAEKVQCRLGVAVVASGTTWVRR
jgi:hypothetical protein